MSDISTKYFSNQGITSSTRYIHTPGEFASSNLLYVQEVGKLKSLRPHKSSREGLKSILFMVIRSGEGFVRTLGREYSLKEGDCVLINCNNQYEHESSETNPWELSWVHFYGASSEELYGLFVKENEGSVVFTPSETESYEKMIEGLMALCNDKSPMSEIYANETLTELMTEVLSDVTKDRETTDDIDINAIRTFINDSFGEKDVLKEACDKINADFAEADAAFEKAYGISMEGYLKVRRFNVAKEKLRFTVDSESNIARECGFADYNDFIRMFADSEGMTPEVYRSKWAQWVR